VLHIIKGQLQIKSYKNIIRLNGTPNLFCHYQSYLQKQQYTLIMITKLNQVK
jgi:hypothetical protein